MSQPQRRDKENIEGWGGRKREGEMRLLSLGDRNTQRRKSFGERKKEIGDQRKV